MKKNLSIDASLPRLTISWDTKLSSSSVKVKKGVFPNGDGLVIGVEGQFSNPSIFEYQNKAIIIFGAAILEDRIDPQGVAKALSNTSSVFQLIKEFNGQFLILIFDKKNKSLTLFNDRFNSIPLYWANINGHFYASYLYFDLFSKIKRSSGFLLREEVILQFLWLNRVLLSDTYDTLSTFLLPASLLIVKERSCDVQRYWRPSFKKTRYTYRSAGKQFVKLLAQSIARLTTEPTLKRYGHFLSGGHDSRAVLACFERPPVCFTIGFSDNLEVRCARSAAEVCGAEHHFIALSDDHFTKYLDSSAVLCGGMYSFMDN